MMLIAYLLLFTRIIVSIAEPIDDGADVGTIQVQNGRRIVLNPGRFPYIVHLEIETEIIDEEAQMIIERHGICGGTLIARQVVLSAAHCVKGPQMNPKITAWLGVLETNLEQGKGQEIPVRGFTMHPHYTKSANVLQNYNDIALLWLTHPATLDGKTVRLARLPNRDFDAVEQEGWIVGWGRRSCGRRTTMLQKALVRGVSASDCQKYYKRTVIPPTFICIMSDDKKKTSTYGDSGGPFVVGDTVVGVTSFGAIDWDRTDKQNGVHACDAKKPAAYTYVPKYVDWIQKSLKEEPETLIRLPPTKQPPPLPPRPSRVTPPVPSRPSRVTPPVPSRPSKFVSTAPTRPSRLASSIPTRSSQKPPKAPPRKSKQ